MRLFRSILRILFVGLVVLVSVHIADAYTLVLRNGRRVEIPNNFLVSGQTLTYEVSTGIQVTVQLVSVDIAATERVNQEAAGSLLKRRRDVAPNLGLQVQKQTGVPSITNQSLEEFRRNRIESEIAYERRRKELGLPTLEESRQLAAAKLEQTVEQVRDLKADEQEIERYWRTRATQLRSEITVTDAQIQYLRRRLDEIPLSLPVFVTAPAFPFGGINRSVVSPALRPPILPRAGVFTAPSVGPQVTARFRVGNTRAPMRPFPGRQFPRSGRLFSASRFGGFVGLPLQSYDYPDQRWMLQTQLDQLLIQREGLQARWRELEDEARRAGAYPGWLRP